VVDGGPWIREPRTVWRVVLILGLRMVLGWDRGLGLGPGLGLGLPIARIPANHGCGR
jgi:hypothetical protein